MRNVGLCVLVGLGVAALAAPASAASDFLIRIGDITGQGGHVDKKTGQQWVPIISWEWDEYIVAAGAKPVVTELHPQGFYEQGSLLVNGKFGGCEVGKSFAEAVLKTPGARYTLQNVVITRCREKDMLVNYGAIRSSASW